MYRADESAFPIERVVVALDGTCRFETVVAAAADIAAQCKAKLTGLFIEDANLFRLATMPAARHISLTSPKAEMVGQEVLEAELRSKGKEATATMTSAAGGRGISCSFHTVRGMPQETLSTFARPGDLLVLPSSQRVAGLPLTPFSGLLRAAESVARAALVVRGSSTYSRPLVVGSDLPAMRSAISAWRRLRAPNDAPVDVVLPDLPRDAMLRALHGSVGLVRPHRPEDESPEALVKLAGTLESDLLIISGAVPVAPADYLRDLLAKVSSPVLLLK